MRCRALPVDQIALALRKGTYRWTAPCGADLPHPSVTRLMGVVERLLSR